MSQAKVDRYKEEKRNREQTVRKEKVRRRLFAVIGTLVVIGLVAWLAWSVYYRATRPAEGEEAKVETTTVDFSAFEDFFKGLDLAFSD